MEFKKQLQKYIVWGLISSRTSSLAKEAVCCKLYFGQVSLCACLVVTLLEKRCWARWTSSLVQHRCFYVLLWQMRGYQRRKDEAPTLLKQKIPTAFSRSVKQTSFKGSLPRKTSFKCTYICDWSVPTVVNTDLHIDFNSPKESWIDSSHNRDGGEVCNVCHRCTLIQWFNSGLQLKTTLFLFVVEPGPWCETWSGPVIWNVCYWSWNIDSIFLRRKAFMGVCICNYSLWLLFCPIGCSLLSF